MKIAICCSSSDEIEKRYLESSQKLLEQIFQKDNDLVFGAMNNGIMGLAYREAKRHNRKVIGIAPEMYKDDFNNLECDTEILTPNINDRTEALIYHSDALLFLPGGIGTIYEFTSSIELKRSKEFDKPMMVYNETGFFDEMLQMLNKVYEKNFTNIKVKSCYEIANDSVAVLDWLEKIN